MSTDQTNSGTAPAAPAGKAGPGTAGPGTAGPGTASEVLLALAPGPGSLRNRLERGIFGAVGSGRLAPGTALPPSRDLAELLGISRWVVTETYGHLVAKGFLEARTGSATRVSATALAGPPPEPASAGRPEVRPGVRPASGERLGPAGNAPRQPYDLAPGVPDLRHVPREAWLRAAREALAEAANDDLATQPPGGHPAARAAVATHLRRARAVAGPDDAVLLTRGASDGMSRIAAALARAGHTHLLVEDPSWPALRDVAATAGLTPVPVPVDDDGVDVAALVSASARTGARAALLTPAHQFPTGSALSEDRRRAVLEWARDVDGIVVEDDYDAEFRYDRRPVAALQGLDPERVLLLGSVSKTLSPAFGIGWAVVPDRWRAAVAAAGGPTPGPSTLDQLAFARFVSSGAYGRHLRAARSRYKRRRAALLAALSRELPHADVRGIAAGMHALVDLAGIPGPDAADVTREAAALGVAVADLRRYLVSPPARSTVLVVGYGNLADPRVGEAVRRLAEAVRAVAAP
ncbi:PLP-dependent aminotransferase family protein [Antribacter sp. KLBMP9083]|uniref:PLP-dependent aminotransferase family protein n=1 Tax=Antribacter soli TaxID=2910976 RepID=A0AA41QFD3_9MICO|nr:PLP-dependent aminotransferase family protein [Antribacter soli]MCF4122111.1 PLP-dependent aminotransferase family protein [Antribacter soli]